MVGIKALQSNLKQMSNFWHSLRYMKLYNKVKNKGKFRSFINFTKKINNAFSGFTFYKKAL